MSDDEDSGTGTTLRWFGPPWPSWERRAPVCEDDDREMRTPYGETCAHCRRVFEPSPLVRGVAIPGYVIAPGRKQGEQARLDFTWTYFHARCFLAEIVGEKLAIETSASWT